MEHLREELRGKDRREYWIESVCDFVRRGIQLKTECGESCCDSRSVYRIAPSGDMEFLREDYLRTYVSTRWMFWCEADFSKEGLEYDVREHVFRIGSPDDLLDFLQEVEQRLAAEGIVPVSFRRSERRVFGRVYRLEEAVRTALCAEEGCRELRESAAAYAKGRGNVQATAAVAATFACFTDKN